MTTGSARASSTWRRPMCHGAVLLVDTAEEEWAGAVGQKRYPPRESGDIVQVGIAGGDEIAQQCSARSRIAAQGLSAPSR